MARLGRRPLLLVMPLVLAAVSTACGGPLSFEDSSTGTGCQPTAEPGEVVREGDPLAIGEPLEGLEVTSMSPADVGRAATAADLPVTWRYHYGVGEQKEIGYSECWCVPPSDGRVAAMSYDSAGGVVVFVDSGQRFAVVRPQPQRGWGC
jgi:hypothetical protein